jgi:hypothetical protein
MRVSKLDCQLYHIMSVSASQRLLAEADPNYAPLEHKVGEVWCSCEVAAVRAVRRGIRQGIYPADAVPIQKEV